MIPLFKYLVKQLNRIFSFDNNSETIIANLSLHLTLNQMSLLVL